MQCFDVVEGALWLGPVTGKYDLEEQDVTTSVGRENEGKTGVRAQRFRRLGGNFAA